MTDTSSSPITSVAQSSTPAQNASNLLPPLLLLELRGTQIEIDRETLINLPESVLIVMFPNGVILSKNPTSNLASPAHIIYVDFNPDMLHFVLSFYHSMEDEKTNASFPDLSRLFGISSGPSSPFTGRRPFVILREELDYFTIPENQTPNHSPLKVACGQHLLKSSKIFDAFERNIHGGNNQAERQLVDMLCLSGFNRGDEWGYRCIEPIRATLVSISLVSLDASDQAIQSGVTQKLLLFWRKPARKCWWDIENVILDGTPNTPVKLWSRRIWTLELALI
ncbi:hypothetical protein DSO57_1004110 [Entomophthora muscae]|uniref:Uncharacterized protein n=1 Tax=Entomophthora muscae TaxID=34485 RepID=A0ACC2TJ32_9FUNG|nr:hypothetical protein DSO57_1004110 [Entomophthora muscae]